MILHLTAKGNIGIQAEGHVLVSHSEFKEDLVSTHLEVVRSVEAKTFEGQQSPIIILAP